MAKKRKHTTSKATGPRDLDARDGKLTINSYKDVADSEDEFHLQREKILLDGGPEAKRRRRIEEDDAFLQPSDEEILRHLESHSESDEEAIERDDTVSVQLEQQTKSRSPSSKVLGVEEEVEDWGSSRKDYYNADNIETEADALEEEAEARRLQQKKLQKMSEADFGLDEDDWNETRASDEEDNDVIIEVLKDVEITSDTNRHERMHLLQVRYPEFDFLANEYLQLQLALKSLHNDSSFTTKESVFNAKTQALTAYIAALSMYFAIFSRQTVQQTPAHAVNPSELHDHNIMDALLKCRQLWLGVRDLEEEVDHEMASEEATLAILEVDNDETSSMSDGGDGTSKTGHNIAHIAPTSRRERIRAVEAEMADLTARVTKTTKTKSKANHKRTTLDEDDSDFGEEETLSSRALAEKLQKKKSLRFYTSQIAQKSNRRAGAGRDAGGDADLPYRERLKERQARLNAEAEHRGKKLDQYGRGTALGDDSADDLEQFQTAVTVRNTEDDYYDMVASTASKRKAAKAEMYTAIAQAKAAGGLVRITDGELGADGKRAIGYKIEKNKGLTPHRKAKNNPRTKKREKYEKKLQKLSSMKAVYKGGEERGGYGGEKTGIKTGLVKSIKL